MGVWVCCRAWVPCRSGFSLGSDGVVRGWGLVRRRSGVPLRLGFRLAATGAGVAAVGVCCRGRGWRGWRAGAFTTTAAATVEAAVDSAVEAAVAVVLSVRRAGPSGVQGRAGPGPGAGPGAGAGAGSAALAGLGCAGRVGSPSAKVVAAVRWAWPCWGCVVAGVCMCGVTSFRYCVLPTAICVLSTGASGRSRCVLSMSVLVRCVCLVRGTASGWGDPFRAISRFTVPSPSFWLSRPGSESR